MRTIARIIFWGLATIGAIVCAGVVAGIVFTVNVRDRAPDVPDQAVLLLDLNRGMFEVRRDKPLLDTDPAPTLFELVRAIDLAVDDPRIKGLVAFVGDQPIGLAQAQELSDAVKRFNAANKFTMAYAQDLEVLGDSGPEVLVARSFDELWMAPTGGVGLTGFVFEVPFFKDALNEFEIDAEFGQRHEYKGGADPFTRGTMPLAYRRSLQDIADGWTGQLAARLARYLSQDVGDVRKMIDNGPYLAKDALQHGLIDQTGYFDEFVERAESLIGGDAETDFIGPVEFLASYVGDAPAEATIAIVQGQGPIGVGGGDVFAPEEFDAFRIAEELLAIKDDENIDAILFRVDSPGGAYGPSDEVWRAVKEVRNAGKPVVVSMGNYAASGGYFVSAGADVILAQPGTLTGSIGVYGGKFATKRLWNNLGVNWARIVSGQNAGMYSSVEPFSPSQRRKFDASLDFVYDDFTQKVSAGRNLSGEDLDAAARGRIWTGEQALSNGLVDALGGYYEALAELRHLLELAGDAELAFIILPEPLDPWEEIAEWLEDGGSIDDMVVRFISPGLAKETRRQVETLLGDVTPLMPRAGELMMPPFRLAR